METNEGVFAVSFSDGFSPEELCDWLAAMFEANGLELKEEERKLFIEQEINGLAFRKLTDVDLKEMGFKLGPRKNILHFIDKIKNSPVKEHNGTTKSIPITPNAPAIGCTMNFNPKIAPVTSGSEPNEGALRACMPYKGHLWPWRTDKSLVVELRNAEYLKEWDLTRDTFLECANRWSTGLVGGDNFIPKFEYKDHSAADIIVELNKLAKIESDIGYNVNRPTTVFLDLRHNDQDYREHLIVHEFGHALGLAHEHQRSKLWKLIKNFIDEDKMKVKLGDRYDDWKEDERAEMGGYTEDYDPDSVMHYWFLREWLKDGYSNEVAVQRHPALNVEAKKALLGVLKRDGNLVSCPSPMDLKFLSDQYKNARGVLDMPQLRVSHKCNMPSGGRGSEPAPKRIETDCGSTMRNFSELKEVTNSSLDLIEWNDGSVKSKLSIYSQTAGRWKTIARKLGLEDTTPGFTNSTAKHHRDIDSECVIEVFGKWLANASELPYAPRFPKSWEGLHTLLVESELGEVAKKLYIALDAPNCSVRK